MTIFNEEAEQALDEYVEEMTEARREEAIIFYEGCTIVTAPTGPPPEYITVEVDTINDPNIMWRGVPVMPAVGDEVIVWENPLSHRREIWGGSGTTGVSGGASWCQVVVVAKCGGDFDDITDAIAWINALAAPPAANLLYVLYVLAGNWIEGADITIPDYVYLVGLNEGTSIELGAFTIIMGDYTGLFNVKITSSDPSYAIDCNGKSNVMLRHVHVTTTSTGGVLYVRGASGLEAHDCIFEATADTWTVYVANTSTVLLNHVIAEGGLGAGGYGLFTAGTCTVTAKWCEFEGYNPVYASAGTTFNHFSCQFDLSASVLAAGTHTALPTKRFNQTLTVAEAGGEFTSLGAAITYINAQGDAAAGKLYGVLMLTGNFAEAANVTIPQYVRVVGMDEGTEIEMGANRLIMGADSSLTGVVVEGTAATHGHVVQLAGNNVVLRDVRIILTPDSAASDALSCVGYYYHELYHVVIETGGASDRAIAFDDVGDTLLWDVKADSTNWTTALYLADGVGGCVVTTKYCEFGAGTDDVVIAATSEWKHFACQFDPDNCTIAGTETPLVTGNARLNDVKMLAYSYMRC